MSSSLKLAAAGLLVVAAAAVAFLLMQDGGAGTDPESREARSVTAEGGPEAGRFSLTGDDGARAEPAAARPVTPIVPEADAFLPAGTGGDAALAEVVERAVLKGRVIDEYGRPVAQAEVTYLPGSAAFRGFGRRSDRDEPEPPAATTDAAGRFELDVELAEEGSRDARRFLGADANLVVRHDAFATLVKPHDDRTVGEQQVGDLVVEAGAWVTGRVVDPAGRPVAGAEVRGRNSFDPADSGGGRALPFFRNILGESLDEVESGADGRFTLTGLRPGLASVTARKEGMRTASVEDLELTVGRGADAGSLVMEQGEIIAGYVLDDRGLPVPGASVRVSSMTRFIVGNMQDLPRRGLGEEMRLRAESDESGWFELAGLSEGTYNVHVSAEGFARVTEENVAVGRRDLRLTLERFGALLVTLRSARDDSPVDAAEFRIRALEDGPRFFGGRRGERAEGVLTGQDALVAAGLDGDPEGVYYIPGAGPRGSELTVEAPGFALLDIEGPAVLSGGLERLTVDLLPESIVSGRVVDEAGAPVADARVRLEPHEEPTADMGGGRFEVSRNVERRIGGPRGGGGEPHSTRTDESGLYELRGVPAGSWDLTVRADAFVRPEALVLDLGEGDQVQQDVTLEVGGSITGLVTEADGELIAGMDVRIESAQPAPTNGMVDALQQQLGRQLAAVMGDGYGTYTATTDAEGRYRRDGLPPGEYTVKLAPPQAMRMGGRGGPAFAIMLDEGGAGVDETARRTTVAKGAEAVVDLVRPPRGEVSGRVTASGEKLEDVEVTLRSAGAFMPFGGRTAITDEFGRYTFEDVESGDYTVSAMAPGAALDEKLDIEVRSGEGVTADLAFSGATLRGRVLDADGGRGAAGVLLTVAEVEEQGGGGGPFGAFGSGFAGEIRMVTSMDDGGGGGAFGSEFVFSGGATSRVKTDGDGNFELKYVKPGKYRIEARGAGYTEGEAGPIDVDDQSVVDGIVIEVVRGSVVAGTVFSGKTGEPLPGVPVRLTSVDGGVAEMTSTEDDGSYRFEGLESGAVRVSVLGSGFGGDPIAEEELSLGTGEERKLNLITDA